jgi:predicted RNA-binding Zn-ribbon protein involved in translation (DUF1610 family)
MIVLKCDTCKKEIEMVFEISINQSPYTVEEMITKAQLTPTKIMKRYLCDKCYEEVMSIIYP